MNHRHFFLILSVTALLFAVLMTACTDKTVNNGESEGLVVRSAFATSALLQEISRVRLTVTARDMDTVVLDNYADTVYENGDSIAFDGQRIYVQVTIPAGRERKFVLEAIEDLGDGYFVTLYRAERVANIFPGQSSIVDLLLEPLQPMVRLSPRRTEVASGANFVIDVQIRNIPNVSAMQLILSPTLTATQPIITRDGPSLGPNGVAFGQYVQDNTRYGVAAVDSSMASIVNAAGNGTVASVEFSASSFINAPADTIDVIIEATEVQLADLDGKAIDVLVYLDNAEVHIAARADSVVTFGDPDLESRIRQTIDIGTDYVFRSQMLNLTYLSAAESGVTTWEGLQWATNLEYAELSYNEAPDLTPLSTLTRLQTLDLTFNGVTNIAPLANIKGLQSLGLRYNSVADIAALSGMTEMRILELGHNHVRNISALSGMWKLERLQLWDQQIANITPMAGMLSLQVLEMSNDSALTNISALQGLDRLHIVYLTGCLNVQTILPLVNNTGIGSGDTLYLEGIPVLESSATEQGYITQLQQRGATVLHGVVGKSGQPEPAIAPGDMLRRSAEAVTESPSGRPAQSN